jgi:uncharacterized protein
MRFHHLFDWDPEKARSNAQKHRVTFMDAAAVLADQEADRYHFERYDDKHSMDEDRAITVASHPADRKIVLVISWTERRNKGQVVTRIISARRANPRERRIYGKAIGGQSV